MRQSAFNQIYRLSTIQTWWRTLLDVTITLNQSYVIFGIPNLEENINIDIMNLCILYGKWYIYHCKKDKHELFIIDYIKLVKDKLEGEKMWCTLRQNNLFEEKWKFFYDNL